MSYAPRTVDPADADPAPPTRNPIRWERRRAVLLAGAGIAATTAVAPRAALPQVAPATRPTPPQTYPRSSTMPLVTARDGTRIHVKDWGAGRPVVFSHGWPLNADAWDDQMNLVASQGYRAVAHDRRGHGRSDQPWNGNDMDTYADDLAAVIEALDLRDAVLVGHSTGGGEVARYLGRHGTRRVSKAVLASAIPPLMLRTAANPGGQPQEAFDAIRKGVATDRSQFYRDLSVPFFGANRPGSAVSQGVRDAFWLQCMQCGLRGALECITAFSESDFNQDFKRIDVPVLVIHGEDDQIVPVDSTARLTAQRVERATLKVVPGGSHGLPVTHRAQFDAELLAFVRG